MGLGPDPCAHTGVGRPAFSGRPKAEDFEQLILLVLVLGVLAVLSNARSCSMAFLLVLGHA